MYKQSPPTETSLEVNESYEGETIEQKVNRIVNNKEPIKDGAPLIFTDRKDGVKPEYDIRTDRFEIAIEMMDKVTADKIAKRTERQLKRDAENKAKTEKDGGAEPIQGTTDKPE